MYIDMVTIAIIIAEVLAVDDLTIGIEEVTMEANHLQNLTDQVRNCNLKHLSSLLTRVISKKNYIVTRNII